MDTELRCAACLLRSRRQGGCGPGREKPPPGAGSGGRVQELQMGVLAGAAQSLMYFICGNRSEYSRAVRGQEWRTEEVSPEWSQ